MKSTKSLLFVFFLFVGQFSFHAYAVPVIKTVGGTAPAPDYATLKLAFDAINAGTVTGDIELQIKGNINDNNTASLTANGSVMSITKVAVGTGYTSVPTVTLSAPPEGGIQATATVTTSGGAINVFTITNPGSGYTSAPTVAITGVGSGATATAVISAADFTSLKIYPTVTNLTLSGAFDGPLISINKANNVTFDGRLRDASGVVTATTADLTIKNTSTAGAAMTIRLKDNASNNTITYCKINGSSTSFTNATIALNTTIAGGGCSNNIISKNIFSGRPWTVIYSAGITTSINTGNQILQNDIKDVMVLSNGSSCFNFGTFNSATEISGNSFYETQTTVFNGGALYNFISVTGGEGYTISNNYIGGNATQCGGTNFIKTSGNSQANTFKGIVINSSITTGTASRIENNVIKNITWTNGSPTLSTAAWTGISVEGAHDVSVIGNTIGNISVSNNTTGSNVIGINKTNGNSNQPIRNNFIYGITSTAASAGQLYGIYISGGLTTLSNNIVSLSTSNAIKVTGIYDHGASGKNNSLYFNTVLVSGTPTTGSLESYALYSNASSNTRDFRNNIFANYRSNGGSANGKHYGAFFNYAVNTNLILDYNNYFVSGMGGVLGRYNSADVTTGSVMVTGKDVNSLAIDPNFTNSVGTTAVSYKPLSKVLNGGTGTGITTDFAGDTRNIPTIGAWEVVPAVDLPTLGATTAATSITTSSASTGGEITDGGTSPLTARGVCWSTSPSPTVDLVTKTVDGLGTGSFSSSLTGLSEITTYYVRSYATNSTGTAYGTQIIFTTLDAHAPTEFTATKGTVTFSSVELLLNATDNSGSINYTISYGSGPTVLNTTGVSGVQKTVKITGLDASTDYTFTVVAKDASNNQASNSPIVLQATTGENTNTECSGTSSTVVAGDIVNGYNYSFSTSGTSVTITFELLDTKTGLVTQIVTPGNVYTTLTLVSGQKYSITLTNQTIGSTITYAGYFPFAGGVIRTANYTYTVGNDCLTVPGKPKSVVATAGNAKASVSFTPSAITGGSAVTEFMVTSSPGALTATGASSPIVVTSLTNGTAYTFTVTATNAQGTSAASAASNEVTPHATTNIIEVSTSSSVLGLTLTPVSDLKVLSGVTLTGNAEKTVNSITVESGGKLNVSSGSPLVVGTLTFKANKDASSFSSKLDDGITATTVRLFKTIDDTKWYFMSFPCAVTVAGIIKSDGQSLGELGVDWFIKYYDGNKRSLVGVSGGSNWVSVLDGTLTAKKGYIFGLKTGKPETEILFPLNPSILNAEVVSAVPVLSYSTGTAEEVHKGWNLIGQPYLSKYDANTNTTRPSYMVMPNPDGKTYTVTSKVASTLPEVNPFAAYFVQSDVDGNISFGLSSRQSAPSVANNLSENVQLNVSTATGVDNTYLIMDNDQTTDYQIGEDMEKWIGTGTDKPQVYTLLGGINYAFNALPMNNVVNLPIGLYTKTSGNSTISVNASHAPSLSKLLLTDISNGTTTDLLVSDYSFIADAGTDNNRFVITAQRVPTDNDLIESGADEPGISMVNGKLSMVNLTPSSLIRVYDATGRLVVSKTANNSSLEIPLSVVGLYTVQIGTQTKNWKRKIVNKK